MENIVLIFAEKFGGDWGMLYLCGNDSVANDYRFVASNVSSYASSAFMRDTRAR